MKIHLLETHAPAGEAGLNFRSDDGNLGISVWLSESEMERLYHDLLLWMHRRGKA